MEKELTFEEKENLDYIKILKSLVEIPFPVGKNLLLDFVTGDGGNNSIVKNKLDALHNFDSISLSREETSSIIDNLINNKLISIGSVSGNRFIKVLEITHKGREEIASPSLYKKKVSANYEQPPTKITPQELEIFKELEPFLGLYNNEQKKAIISNNEKILCIAGAGSGKTTVLTKRIEFLNKFRNVDPSKILAITFTRKARQEMQDRLNLLGINTRVETFNSFCEKILRQYSSKIYSRPTRIGNYGDKIIALTTSLNLLGLDLETAIDKYFSDSQKRNKTYDQLTNIFMNDCFSVIDYFKLKNQEFKDFSEVVDREDKEIAKMIYDIASQLKSYTDLQGLRSYTDQMIDAISFLKENNESIPNFEHILVDEYQDVNSTQIELLDLLNSKNLFAVGDPRQSIYGWRGSELSHILKFHQKFPDAQTITLTKNYRSRGKIVDLMNHSIKEMGLPFLASEIGGDHSMNLLNFESEKEEFQFIVNEMLHLDIPLDNIFVLARTNRQLLELSNLMKKNNIPHIIKAEDIHTSAPSGVGAATLATIHAIKGLEANTVFVMGCNELNFPCKASDHPVIEIIKMNDYDKEEEEKRLFYVAISRAKERLYLTYTGKRKTYFINSDMDEIIKS